MGVVKARYTKASSGGGKGAKAGVRYATHRVDSEGERQTRGLYDQDGEVTKREAYERIDHAEQAGGKYHYRLILNQGQGHGEADMQAMTRDTMRVLSDRHEGRVEWVAVDHTDHSQHDHTHVVAVTEKTLSKADLAAMRAEMDRSHERHSYRDELRHLATERTSAEQRRDGGHER